MIIERLRKVLASRVVTSALFGTALTLAATSTAAAEQWSYTNGFEGGDAAAWQPEGGAGVDYNLGYAFAGQNNGWMRGTTGFNALHGSFYTPGVNSCILSFRFRGSPAVDSWYLGVYDGDSGAQLAGWGPWTTRNTNCTGGAYCIGGLFGGLPINARGARRVRVHIGFWGNQTDQWLQIDDVTLGCSN